MTRMICDKFPFGPSYQILNKCVQCRLYNIILWKLETIWFITWLSHYFIPFHHWIFQNRSKKNIEIQNLIYFFYMKILRSYLFFSLVKFLQHRNIEVNTEWYGWWHFFIFFIRRVLIYNQPSLSPCFPFFF